MTQIHQLFFSNYGNKNIKQKYHFFVINILICMLILTTHFVITIVYFITYFSWFSLEANILTSHLQKLFPFTLT